MGLIPTIQLDGRSLAHRQRVPHSAGYAERVTDLSSWMMVLGTIRLICALADYANAYLEAARLEPMSLRRLVGFVQENHPIIALGAAWPLILGLALRRTRWPELLKAGAVTFLILSIGGLLAITADWNQSREKWITLGSFRVPQQGLWQPGLADLMLGLLGATQLVLELGTAVRAIQLAFHTHSAPAETAAKHAAARRARFGRLALYGSAAYLVLMIRLPVWSAYLDVVNQSRFVREFILQNDFQRLHSTRRLGVSTPDLERFRDLQSLMTSAMQAWGAGRFSDAKDHYLHLAALVETIPTATMSPPAIQLAAQGLNNLAWLLATCPEDKLRDPQGAVDYARRALDLVPSDGNTWNTLGVAYYRAENWEQARSALFRSMELRNEGDSFDWFFLSMIHAKLGHKERAHEGYLKAVEWFHQHRPGDAELYRFQVEAAQGLGLPQPEQPPPPAQVARPPVLYRNPMMIPRRGRPRIIDPTESGP
jgi:tetratricopeptide (TPR) repeat protein